MAPLIVTRYKGRFMTASKKKKTVPHKDELPDKDSGADEPRAKEYGGRDGPEPTRYGDWEKKGIISDF